MSKTSRFRPTYAGITSTLALVIALGSGGAYAASSLIHTKQIANGAVTTKKLAPLAVTAPKLANGAVGSAKLDAATKADIVPPWGTIPHGKLVTGTFADDTTAGNGHQIVKDLTLPARAPVALTDSKLAFGAATGITGDPRCAGTYSSPNPAAGVFCVYLYSRSGLTVPVLTTWSVLGSARSVFMYATPTGAVGSELAWWGVWAYRAP